MPTLNELLAESLWVATLTPEERKVVEQQTVTRDVAKGDYVCHKGEPVRHWIGVVDGLVKIATASAQGRLATFSGVPAGGWFGEGSLLKDVPRQYEVVALRHSQIAYVPAAVFQWLAANNARFTGFLLVQLNERLGQAMAIIEHQRLLGVEGRVAQCLAGLFNRTLFPGTGPTLHISQEEIGLLVGVSRQRVNQALQVLQDRGLLRLERLGVTVVELEQLRAFEE